jgi:hypothetical protein
VRVRGEGCQVAGSRGAGLSLADVPKDVTSFACNSFTGVLRHFPSRERAASPISRGSTLIAMMQTADLGEGNNTACGGKLHATRPWAVLVDRRPKEAANAVSEPRLSLP